MKKLAFILLIILILALSGCSAVNMNYDIVATTLPVYDLTSMLCEGTDLSVGRLVTESVSCLHDYTLKVSQMRMLEGAELVVISGAGLEDFLTDALQDSQTIIDTSENINLHPSEHTHHESHSHRHETDPHFWLSPENAVRMAETIAQNLADTYPGFADIIQANLQQILNKLTDLQNYGQAQLAELTCRELITFHDGFSYFAQAFDLTILEAVEEESGSEASAQEIIHLVSLVNQHRLTAVFTEISGSDACAGIIASETGVTIYTLDMAMAGDSYFQAMYHNIDTIKEALK